MIDAVGQPFYSAEADAALSSAFNDLAEAQDLANEIRSAMRGDPLTLACLMSEIMETLDPETLSVSRSTDRPALSEVVDVLIGVPIAETSKKRGGIHNSGTRLLVKPSHLIGGYAQLSYAFNYLGPTGNQRDEVTVIRRRSQNVEY